MVHFQQISLKTFLCEYWQKKPLIIRNALPQFINQLSPNELAGLALEEDIESRIVEETPGEKPQWHLKRGPFSEQDFAQLPKTHWTLLVQGVDRVIPEIGELLNHFNFIPQWRIDDVMISYASLHGSVGPHYDNYDVFLFQALGRREWNLTSQQCTPDNYIEDLELRIMREFNTEEHYILEEGDMLYLPPHIGHYGISLSEECMTYSFGYRSYTGAELLDSLSDFVSEKGYFKTLYEDPDWSTLTESSEIPSSALQNAQKLLMQLISDKKTMRHWFGCFITRLDQHAEQQLPMPFSKDEVTLEEFLEELKEGPGLIRDACCRFAIDNEAGALYINGCEWEASNVSKSLLLLVTNNRFLPVKKLIPFLEKFEDQHFLFELWKLQWLYIEEQD